MTQEEQNTIQSIFDRNREAQQKTLTKAREKLIILGNDVLQLLCDEKFKQKPLNADLRDQIMTLDSLYIAIFQETDYLNFLIDEKKVSKRTRFISYLDGGEYSSLMREWTEYKVPKPPEKDTTEETTPDSTENAAEA